MSLSLSVVVLLHLFPLPLPLLPFLLLLFLFTLYCPLQQFAHSISVRTLNQESGITLDGLVLSSIYLSIYLVLFDRTAISFCLADSIVIVFFESEVIIAPPFSSLLS